ncbi:glutathione reductase, putative [Babesia ovis]|uniref:Glutathione reductase, putative n=1 Tax=Babesia ovis TaxID=5869 RepID=A0A9W5WTM7_BABOV|nr:glutathione reductase, putative [Babesia ovis]
MNALGIVAAFAALFVQYVSSSCTKFIPVDISTGKTKTYMRRVESDNVYSMVPLNGTCIGDVLNHGTLITDYPEGIMSSRKVTVYVYEKTDPWTGPFEPAVDEDSLFQVVEVESIYKNVPIRQRFVMSSDGTYQEVNYEFQDMDICSDNLNDFVAEKPRKTHSGGVIVKYFANTFKRIGAVKCGEHVLLERDDSIFMRYADRVNNAWDIITVPVVGKMFTTSFFPVAWEECPYRILDKGSTYLDVSLIPKTKYDDILASCGEKCLFFDGCSNPERRFVDVVDNSDVISMGAKTHCVNVKLQTVGEERYLAIYSQMLDGNFETAYYVSQEGGRFVPHKPKPINLELTSEKVDENIQVSEADGVKTYTIPSPNNLKYTIGAVTYKNEVLVGKSFIENPENLPYTVYERKVVVDNGYTTIRTVTNMNPSTEVTYITNNEGVWSYTPKTLDVDLAKLNTKDPMFNITQVTDGEYQIEAADPRTNIGTVKYKGQIVHRSHPNVLKTGLLYRGGEIAVTSLYSDMQVVKTKYLYIQGSIDDDENRFVEQYKEPLTLQLEQLLGNELPEYFCTEPHGKYTKVFVCQDEFGQTLGEVNFLDQQIVPTHRYFKSREVYVSSEYFLDNVLVKSISDDGTIVIDSFTTTPSSSALSFNRHTKQPIPVDISPTVAPHKAISRIQDGHNFYYHIKPEYSINYRIGEVTYHGKSIKADDDSAASRNVRVTVESVPNGQKTIYIGIADAGHFGHKSYMLTGDAELHDVKEVQRKPVDLDISFRGEHNPAIAIGITSDTLSFTVPWTHACEYTLANVVCTGDKGTVYKLYSDLQLDEMPEVRVRSLNEGSKAIVSITPSKGAAMYTDIQTTDKGGLKVKEMKANQTDGLFVSYYGQL